MFFYFMGLFFYLFFFLARNWAHVEVNLQKSLCFQLQKVDQLLKKPGQYPRIRHLAQLSADPWDHATLNAILSKDVAGSKRLALQDYFQLESKAVRLLRLNCLVRARLYKLAMHYTEFVVESRRADAQVLSVFFGLKHYFKVGGL